MLDELEKCFELLQTLDIKPTLDNMEKLVQTLYVLRDVYNKLKEGADDGRATTDPE